MQSRGGRSSPLLACVAWTCCLQVLDGLLPLQEWQAINLSPHCCGIPPFAKSAKDGGTRRFVAPGPTDAPRGVSDVGSAEGQIHQRLVGSVGFGAARSRLWTELDVFRVRPQNPSLALIAQADIENLPKAGVLDRRPARGSLPRCVSKDCGTSSPPIR